MSWLSTGELLLLAAAASCFTVYGSVLAYLWIHRKSQRKQWRLRNSDIVFGFFHPYWCVIDTIDETVVFITDFNCISMYLLAPTTNLCSIPCLHVCFLSGVYLLTSPLTGCPAVLLLSLCDSYSCLCYASDSGGGGERVLWIAVHGLLTSSNLLRNNGKVVIYTGDSDKSKATILSNVQVCMAVT